MDAWSCPLTGVAITGVAITTAGCGAVAGTCIWNCWPGCTPGGTVTCIGCPCTLTVIVCPPDVPGGQVTDCTNVGMAVRVQSAQHGNLRAHHDLHGAHLTRERHLVPAPAGGIPVPSRAQVVIYAR